MTTNPGDSPFNKRYSSGNRRLLKKRKRKVKSRRLFDGIEFQTKVKIYPRRKKITFRRSKIKPPYSENIQYLSSNPNIFNVGIPENKAYFAVPKCFSLLEEYDESYKFLKQLFYSLYNGKVEKIIIDYNICTRIDVDASIIMDVILMDFVKYCKACSKNGVKYNPKQVDPINFSKLEISKVLFSIGAFKNLSGIEIPFQGVISLPVLIANNKEYNVWEKSELHQTKIVSHIQKCLKQLNRNLSQPSENEFYKVIGEIMNNAEEHGTVSNRYAIGLFQETHNPDQHFGIYNLTIFNFGKTIYETFKTLDPERNSVIKQMMELSEQYTRRGLFKKAQFEEETLWTLYALQEGVTSKPGKRGNGSIQFIENFFKLKGNSHIDNISKLVIISGNTRIEFDGSYPIQRVTKSAQNRSYKMVTFNESGSISEVPDKKYVTFVPNFFPGTMITARILMDYQNTTNIITCTGVLI